MATCSNVPEQVPGGHARRLHDHRARRDAYESFRDEQTLEIDEEATAALRVELAREERLRSLTEYYAERGLIQRNPPVSSPVTASSASSSAKAYEQVADRLRQLIVTEELVRGERLPNELQLADDFGVSRATVREALRLLAAQSLIRRERGWRLARHHPQR